MGGEIDLSVVHPREPSTCRSGPKHLGRGRDAVALVGRHIERPANTIRIDEAHNTDVYTENTGRSCHSSTSITKQSSNSRSYCRTSQRHCWTPSDLGPTRQLVRHARFAHFAIAPSPLRGAQAQSPQLDMHRRGRSLWPSTWSHRQLPLEGLPMHLNYRARARPMRLTPGRNRRRRAPHRGLRRQRRAQGRVQENGSRGARLLPPISSLDARSKLKFGSKFKIGPSIGCPSWGRELQTCRKQQLFWHFWHFPSAFGGRSGRGPPCPSTLLRRWPNGRQNFRRRATSSVHSLWNNRTFCRCNACEAAEDDDLSIKDSSNSSNSSCSTRTSGISDDRPDKNTNNNSDDDDEE
mmetsp:Transcript_24883/g.54110  ORF Transcript_24883/g.54110 Transcript_24883/m.54110 type:complete len:350 (-) Transcript_24883:300-1349(-)